MLAIGVYAGGKRNVSVRTYKDASDVAHLALQGNMFEYYMSMVRNFVEERDMLMEALPCSDPKENVVRVVPLVRTDDLATSKVMERVADRPVFGRLGCMSGPVFTDIIKELRSIAKVPVYVDMTDCLMDGADMDLILIDLIEAYEFMRMSESANSNAFVHIWSIVDRIRSVFELVNISWIIGEKNCVGSSEAIGISEAMDTHMYSRDIPPPKPILDVIKGSGLLIREDICEEFSSFYDIHVSVMVPKKEVVNIAAMIAKQSQGPSTP
ncbi:hypothetical protein DL767_002813 [Monosporascus sp. MG133]|nr:hypothetical protein DL767_002813 [Monosporascus sp. MG133]